MTSSAGLTINLTYLCLDGFTIKDLILITVFTTNMLSAKMSPNFKYKILAFFLNNKNDCFTVILIR